jgi:hypothetical protein
MRALLFSLLVLLPPVSAQAADPVHLQLGRRVARDHHARHRAVDGDRPAPANPVINPINLTNLINL